MRQLLLLLIAAICALFALSGAEVSGSCRCNGEETSCQRSGVLVVDSIAEIREDGKRILEERGIPADPSLDPLSVLLRALMHEEGANAELTVVELLDCSRSLLEGRVGGNDGNALRHLCLQRRKNGRAATADSLLAELAPLPVPEEEPFDFLFVWISESHGREVRTLLTATLRNCMRQRWGHVPMGAVFSSCEWCRRRDAAREALNSRGAMCQARVGKGWEMNFFQQMDIILSLSEETGSFLSDVLLDYNEAVNVHAITPIPFFETVSSLDSDGAVTPSAVEHVDAVFRQGVARAFDAFQADDDKPWLPHIKRPIKCSTSLLDTITALELTETNDFDVLYTMGKGDVRLYENACYDGEIEMIPKLKKEPKRRRKSTPESTIYDIVYPPSFSGPASLAIGPHTMVSFFSGVGGSGELLKRTQMSFSSLDLDSYFGERPHSVSVSFIEDKRELPTVLENASERCWLRGHVIRNAHDAGVGRHHFRMNITLPDGRANYPEIAKCHDALDQTFRRDLSFPSPFSGDLSYGTAPETRYRSLRFAYFVMVGPANPAEQVDLLLRTLWDPKDIFLLHVDGKASEAEVQVLASKFSDWPNVRVMLQRKRITWGGYNILDAELLGAGELLAWADSDPGVSWDFLINLSASDFPVYTREAIEARLSYDAELNWLETFEMNHGYIKARGLHSLFFECDDHVYRISDYKRLPSDIRLFGGSMWFVLSYDFVSSVLRCLGRPFFPPPPLVDENCPHDSEPEQWPQPSDLGTEAARRVPSGGLDVRECRLAKLFRQYCESMLISDEVYFQTVLLNTRFCNQLAPHNMRYVNWKKLPKSKSTCLHKEVVDWCGASPVSFEVPDLRNVFRGPGLFARKYEFQDEDVQLLQFWDPPSPRAEASERCEWELPSISYTTPLGNAVDNLLRLRHRDMVGKELLAPPKGMSWLSPRKAWASSRSWYFLTQSGADGVASTRWFSEVEERPHFSIELEGPAHVKEISILWEQKACPSRYTIAIGTSPTSLSDVVHVSAGAECYGFATAAAASASSTAAFPLSGTWAYGSDANVDAVPTVVGTSQLVEEGWRHLPTIVRHRLTLPEEVARGVSVLQLRSDCTDMEYPLPRSSNTKNSKLVTFAKGKGSVGVFEFAPYGTWA